MVHESTILHGNLIGVTMSFFRTIAVGGSALLFAAACHHSPADEHMGHESMAVQQSNQPGGTALPPSAMHTNARLASSPRHGEWVRVAWEPGSKDSIQAWIVYPTNSSAKAPVVVVIHEIFGLSNWVRAVTDQVAADGFIAIAPDLNSRVRGGPSMDSLSADSANKLSRLVTIPERNKAIVAVAKYAMSQAAAVPRYAVIGFCYGGQTVWGHAVSNGTNGYAGGVAFYGAFPFANGAALVADSMKKINKPVMLLSGSKDARIGATMPAIDSIMKANGKWYYGSNYPGAVHGFARAQDDPKAQRDEVEEKANLDAIKDAWPRTLAFLRTNLGVKK
jgi:carboxymethylenebutenolidase